RSSSGDGRGARTAGGRHPASYEQFTSMRSRGRFWPAVKVEFNGSRPRTYTTRHGTTWTSRTTWEVRWQEAAAVPRTTGADGGEGGDTWKHGASRGAGWPSRGHGGRYMPLVDGRPSREVYRFAPSVIEARKRKIN
ncbi:hypothetical protein THAOC_22986, partial [Thalassiosira oceanica]